MANFVFNVDTTPLAKEVDSVSHHVTGVQGAVIAMQTAVIATERQCATEICQNVDRGFYFLINSQISQKIAKLNSEVTSKLMVLGQLGVALKGIQRQMQNDYAMISSRYVKLFKTLDHALQKRVFELDKAASKLALAQRNDGFSRLRDMGGTFLIHQKESIPDSQSMVSSKIKQNAAKSVQFITQRLSEEEFLKNQLKSVITDTEVTGRNVLKMPLIITEMESMVGTNTYSSVIFPQLPSSFSSLKGEMETATREKSSAMDWRNVSAEQKKEVRDEYFSILEKTEIDERTKTEMFRLFDVSEWVEPAGAEL